MKATDLIGKNAIRTAKTEHGDYSITDYPIEIIDATNSQIYYKYADKWHRTYLSKDTHILGPEFCDNNWTEYKYNLW